MSTAILEPTPSEGSFESSYGELLDTYGNKFKVPDFTVKQVRDAIPAHCFERSAVRGFSYVARDILLLTLTFYLFHTYNTPMIILSPSIRFSLWVVYGFLQGLFATGLWVLAHECGHQSFSTSKTINDTTGWFLHSALLVPYFSWKISHGKHHKSTGHMERDMVFLPKTREVYASRIRRQVHEITELTEEAPFVTALVLIGRQLIGWPLYLLQNNTGHNYHERQSEGRGKGKHNGPGGGVNHFNPSSPLFDAKDAKYIALSDLGLGLTATVLYQIAQRYGWGNVAVWYIIPYLWVNHWLGRYFSGKVSKAPLTLPSGNYLPSTYRSDHSALRSPNLDFRSWRRHNRRSGIRLHRPLSFPWHHRNSCGTPFRIHYPILPCR